MNESFGPDQVLLDAKVALVTGGAQGIGAATALTLARFGADIAVCDKLGDPLAAVAARHGRVDIVVNNAGGGFFAPFLEVSPKGQAALVAENFTQVTAMIRGCVPLMTNGGSIVNITSIEGHRAGPGFAVYSAMKAAVESLTKTLALELADRHIRVNAVAPDMIPTPGDADLISDSGAMSGATYAQPWPTGGTTWDCAAAVLFLAGPLSSFMTGSTLHVDGGTYAASGWTRRDGGGWKL